MTLRRRLYLAGLAAVLAGPVLAQTVDIRISGADADDLRPRLENASLTASLPAQEDVAAQDYVAAARADYQRILTGLYGAGYYGGTISIQIDGREASGIQPLDAPRNINSIIISVTPGPQFTFGTAQVGPLPDGALPPDRFARGEVASAAVIQDAARSAVTSWREAGYALAAPSGQQITANHPASELDATVTIAPGAQLRFGQTTITGNEAVRTERVAEIAGVPEGRVFSPYELTRVQTRLRRTGTFRSVAIIEPDVAGPNATLPLEIQVVEEAPRRIGFGAEYSTLDGATLSAFWLHRNLLGGAERFRVEGEASGIAGGTGGIDYRVGLSFGRPATIHPEVDLLATATLQRLDEPDYLLDQFSVDVGLTQYRTERLTYGAGIGFVTAREETPQRTREYTLVTIPITGEYDYRDDPLNPNSGFYVNLDIRPFFGLEGAENGARLFADSRFYRSFGTDDRVTLAARFQLGSILSASASSAPADYLFYAGGGGTVRGQSYQALGIELEQDFGNGPVTVRTGGTSFAGAQLEARVDVTQSIGVVGFYDIGVVSDQEFPTGDDEFVSGAGFGLRYNTGIGPIRFDVATPANGDDVGERVEFYIGIGQSF